MKLMETLPLVFVALVAAAALVLDDVPAYERAPRPERPAAERSAAMVQAKEVPVEKSLSPNESLIAIGPMETAMETPTLNAAGPVVTRAPKPKAASAQRKPPAPRAPTRDAVALTDAVLKTEAPRSRVNVEGRRLSPDERLQHAVRGAIKRLPNLSGRVAVETRDAVVRLSGWTTTPGQSLRAEKAAARVEGVRQVVNEIRPRMGAITS